MFAWIVGAILPASALCVAALLAEQATRQRRLPGRWIWIAAMSLSILLPIVGPWLPMATPIPLLRMPMAGAGPALALQPFDALGPLLWLAFSIATVLVLTASAALVQRRSRAWRRTRVGDLDVYVARETGPTVFGLWRPRIVLPDWLNQAPPRQRELAIAHEQSHLVAHDPRLLACALVLVSIMPWNLPLWWQLRRLRCAIEVDCDERVLRAGGNVVDYGETLIHLSQHRTRSGGLMAATSEPQSFLERRIQIMSSEISRWSRLAAAAWMCLAVGAVAIAAELTPPSAGADPAATQAHARDPAAAQAAKVEAEIAAKRARVAKQDADGAGEAEEAESAANDAMRDADEQMAAANEAMRDAEAQKAEAMVAKREAEAAAAEASARKRAAERAAAH